MSSPTSQSHVRKRPRKIWSCLECRRKKLQCDHGHPTCGRCTRAGIQEKCTYTDQTSVSTRDGTIEGPVDGARASTGALSYTACPAGSNVLERVETVENRLRKLESRNVAARIENGQRSLPDQATSRTAVATPTVKGSPSVKTLNTNLLRGVSFRTKFNGNTCSRASADHIPDMISFTNDASANFPALQQIQLYLDKSEGRSTLAGLDAPANTKDDLRALLPLRAESDDLIRIYFETFDYLFPILQPSAFQRSYPSIWLAEAELDTRFVVIVLLVIAVAQCLISMPSNATDSRRTPRDQATVILDGCEYWLRTRVQAYDTVVDFQIGFLFLLGRQLNSKRSKRTYCNAGNTLRTFMCAGMHRDPDHLTQETSSMDKEMRRRLWSAAAEFELQAAFEHGMPAMNWLQQSNISPPVNMDGENHLSRQIYTRVTYLAVLGESLQLRHQLNSELNDLHRSLSSREVSDYTLTLKDMLHSLPKWEGPCSVTIHALLSITLHQYILALHEQQLRNASSDMERQYSRLALLESSTQIIDCHQIALDSGGQVIELLNGDHLRAAMAICYAYTTSDPMADQILMSMMKLQVQETLSRLIIIFSDKIIRYGGSQLHLWLIAAADALVKCKADPARRDVYMQGAVEQYAAPFYRLMASAKRAASGEATSKHQLGQKEADIANQLTFTNDMTLGAFNMPSLDDVANWTFDDFSFDPIAFVDF